MKVLLSLLFLGLASAALALGGNPNVVFKAAHGTFPLVTNGGPARVKVDPTDWPGVARAAEDLRSDLVRISGIQGKPVSRLGQVIVGTLGRSPSIDALVQTGKLDVSGIRGKWEASVTQVVGNDLVIAGSDKRGTIYALYDLSEAAGVSPWNWWADVPVKNHPTVYVHGRYVAKPPVVKYRGIFLNDEAPALSNWVRANFGEYNHRFYERVFELLLRLRANYLWPAMWNNRFSVDDELNPKLAEEYGIVMGTSHVEPMMRADKEWNRLGFTEKQWNYATNPNELEKFWTDGVVRNKPYENIVTMAMRGKIDTPMSETANIELLERIVAAQRKILATNVNPDVTQIPQLWCLYKEVQEYYEKGMRVPDDVTLLWSDDNWGNIRRLPTADERNRSGGAGVYYHFDYVGGPRNYKWLNTNPIPKIWQQMTLAHAYGADRIWIVNVGDLKPMEFPLEFFLTLARDPNAIKKEQLGDYTRRWAEREFGAKSAKEIAEIISATGRMAGRRKPELIDSGIHSIENYDEANRVKEEGASLLGKALSIGAGLPKQAQSAYFQLIVHPLKAQTTLHEMYRLTATNALYAKQGRANTNDLASQVRAAFARDAEVTKEYHAVNDGKWNHFMDQTHIGYTSWQQPETNVMPKVTKIEVPEVAQMGIAIEGSGTEAVSQLGFTRYGQASRRVEVFRRGTKEFEYSATTKSSWIRLGGIPKGILSDGVPQQKIYVSIDWSKLPSGDTKGTVEISGAGIRQTIEVWARNSVAQPGAGDFVEGDGVVVIEAEHASRRVASGRVRWETIPGYGRTLSAVAPFPAPFDSFAGTNGPRIEYDFQTFTTGRGTLELTVSPSLAFQPNHGLRIAVAIDAESPQVIDLAASYLSPAWERSVEDAVRKLKSDHLLAAGRHTLRLWALDPGVVLERITIDLGGLKPSYLGPPESRRISQ